MSDPVRVLLLGATGMVGQAVLAAAVGDPALRLVALGRRAAPLPAGVQMEQLVADPGQWPAAIAAAQPQVLVLALGTTIAAVHGDRVAFRAVDHDLVLAAAGAAQAAGVPHVVLVSSAGADPASRNFYLATKGETERDILALGFARVDILRPGLLRGRRQGAPRPAERLGMVAMPLLDWVLPGDLARYRSIRAETVAGGILALAQAGGSGQSVHNYREIHSLARRRLT